MNQNQKTIILLEDEPQLRSLMLDALTQAGYLVHEAATQPALASALEATGGHAILIADRAIEKGDVNGFQAAAAALEQFPALRVIYISGTHIAIRRRVMTERERGLLKPFAMSHLLNALRELGG